MKKLLKTFGFIALTAVIGFAIASCDDSDKLDGTSWISDSGSVVYTFNKPNYTSIQSTYTYSGTYSVSGSTVVFTPKGGGNLFAGELLDDTLTINGTVYTKLNQKQTQ